MILAVASRTNEIEWNPNDYRVCTTLTHTEYVFNDPHLRALSAFCIIFIGVLMYMLWKKYRKEDDDSSDY